MSKSEEAAMTEQEWLERYKRRFMDVAGLNESQAEACAQAETFAVLSEFFEDNPEGAADEEMSCWEDDSPADPGGKGTPQV